MPESTYAVVKCGGTQHRVEEGTTLLVDRLKGDEGASIDLEPLLDAGGKDTLLASSDLGRIKLRIFKFKPKRGYKRTTGHRSELTRIEVTSISVGKGSSSSKKTEEAEDGS